MLPLHTVAAMADCPLNQESPARRYSRYYVHVSHNGQKRQSCWPYVSCQPHQFLPLSNVDQTATIRTSNMELGDMAYTSREGANFDVLLPTR